MLECLEHFAGFQMLQAPVRCSGGPEPTAYRTSARVIRLQSTLLPIYFRSRSVTGGPTESRTPRDPRNGAGPAGGRHWRGMAARAGDPEAICDQAAELGLGRGRRGLDSSLGVQGA